MGNSSYGPETGGGSFETAVFQEVKAPGIQSHAFSSTTFEAIEFNTEIVPQSWVSLSSNQFTLDAGIYYFVYKPTWQVMPTNIDISVYDVNASDVIGGTKTMLDTSSDVPANNTIPFYLNISSQVTFELRYYILGIPSNIFGRSQGTEYYQHLSITKIG